ncbi:hypothetical protein ACTL6U_19765 [Rhodovibrionaceae bacterium A322]
MEYIQIKRRENEKYLRRVDFDPLDLPRLMPSLQIVEEVPGQKDPQGRCRLRWRLMGSAFHPSFREKTKDRFLDEVLEEDLYLDLRRSYDSMKEDGKARYLTAHQQMTPNNLYRYERIIVPALTEEGPMHFIGCWHWHRDLKK